MTEPTRTGETRAVDKGVPVKRFGIDDKARRRMEAALRPLCGDRADLGVEAVIAALGIEQYGKGWHHNTFTGELEPIEDEGNHTRLYRLWGLDEPQPAVNEPIDGGTAATDDLPAPTERFVKEVADTWYMSLPEALRAMDTAMSSWAEKDYRPRCTERRPHYHEEGPGGIDFKRVAEHCPGGLTDVAYYGLAAGRCPSCENFVPIDSDRYTTPHWGPLGKGCDRGGDDAGV